MNGKRVYYQKNDTKYENLLSKFSKIKYIKQYITLKNCRYCKI